MSEDSPKPPPQSPLSQADIAALSATAYEDLRRLAKSRLKSNGPLTLLDTAGLVSDTYRRLALQHNLRIESRAHFLAYCSHIMRSIIIDLIRERNAAAGAAAARQNHPEHLPRRGTGERGGTTQGG